MYVFDRAWQVALDQARAVRMAAGVGIPGAPPPYGAATYVQAYPGGGYYGQHPPPYGNVSLFLLAACLRQSAVYVLAQYLCYWSVGWFSPFDQSESHNLVGGMGHLVHK